MSIGQLLCQCHQLLLGNNGVDALSLLRQLSHYHASIDDPLHQLLIDNAIGCIYASTSIGKPNLAHRFFDSARLAASSHISTLTRYALIYNTGLCWLHCNQAEFAFDHLLAVLRVFPANPRIWLRLAECCILANRMVWIYIQDGPELPYCIHSKFTVILDIYSTIERKIHSSYMRECAILSNN